MIPEGVDARRARRLLNTLDGLAIEARSIETVTGWAPWSPRPRTFRVATTTHGDVKVRFMWHARRAARVDLLTRTLGDPRLPTLVGRVGATTVERWVDGTALRDDAASGEHVTAAADILGTLHRFGGVGRQRLPHQRVLGDAGRQTMERLDELAGRGLLTTPEAAQLSQIAADLPERGLWGVIHTDFGGDNLVASTAGGIVSIDNEHLVRGFLDFDVARSWYRWPLPGAAWRAFVRSYEERAEREVPPPILRAWIVAAASLGVQRRLRLGADVDVALRRLRAIPDD